MRTIKFRGKLCHSKQWIEGNLIIAKDGHHYIIPSNFLEPDGHHLIIDSDTPFWVIPESVGQFTGLTDKKGVEIYDGDIVHNDTRTPITRKEDDRNYLVEWVEGKYKNTDEGRQWMYQRPSFNFNKINKDGKNYMSLIFGKEQIEIIGNIHDNPELIK